jgi:hypothetical protein
MPLVFSDNVVAVVARGAIGGNVAVIKTSVGFTVNKVCRIVTIVTFRFGLNVLCGFSNR